MRRLLVTASSAALALGLATAASAQDAVAVPDAVDEIIVVGLPDQVADISDVKRLTDGVVDTITNAEIELLADFTLAEAATRIPGVYAVAANGQPRFLALRGFDARYNSTDLDGNPIWNSSENNRGTQLDLLPSSAVNQIDVFKAITPDMDGNSIGGHLGIRTMRAFDDGGRPYFGLRAEYATFEQDHSRSDRPSYRIDGVGKLTFGPDDKFGAVFGFDSQRELFSQESYRLPDGLQVFRNSAGQDVEIPLRGNWRFDESDITERHDSAFAKIEARIDERLYAFGTVNYYRAADEILTDRRRAFVDSRADRMVSAEQGKGVAGRGTDAYQVIDSTRDVDTWLLAGGVDYQLDALSAVRLRGSWSRVRLEEDFFNSGRFEDSSANRTFRTFDITGDFGVITRDTAVGINPANYIYNSATYEEDTRLDDDLYSLRLDYDHNAYADSRGLGFRAGVALRRLERGHDRLVAETSLPGTYTLAGNRPDITRVDYFDVPIAIDRALLNARLLALGTTVRTDVANRGADYELREDVYAGYAMGVYATDRLRVVGGLRVERTELTDDIFTVVDGVVRPDSFENGYTSLLPSAHLSYDVTPDLRLRASWSRTIGRPDFEAFAFGSQVTNDGFNVSIVTGNRDIEPRQADSFDLGLEYYFPGSRSYAAFGVFRKQLKNEHFSQTEIVENPADPSGDGTISTTTYSSNGKATVDGFEASLVMKDLPFLPPALEGFGVIANYTYLDGQYDVVLNDGARRSIDSLRNQPRQLVNLTALYERGSFSAAVAWNWADESFTGEFQSVPGDAAHPSLNDVFTAEFGTLDAKMRYRLTPTVELSVAGKNLTDEVWTQKTGLNRDLASRATRIGSSWFVGLRIRM